MAAGAALERLLAGTNLRAVPTGPSAWRIEVRPVHVGPAQRPVKPKPFVRPPRPSAAPSLLPEPEIVVTATKRGDSIQSAPLSATIIPSQSLAAFGAVPDTYAVSALAEGLVLTNLGPGRNRSFLRGVADSPFNGVTQGTVALEVDDARVTFNAPDPDLRLVDIERIELLEGPQGPLHGSGALGGVYRIVPTPPKLENWEGAMAADANLVENGGEGWSGNAIANIPLLRGRIGLRVVAYGAREPGWIDRAGAKGVNSNVTDIVGGRAALRWQPAPDWTIDLAGLFQLLHARDSQYATSPVRPYVRAGQTAEPHDNDLFNGRLAVNGRIGSAHLVAVTSWTSHEVDTALDASTADARFGLTGPLRFDDGRMHRLFNQEVRLSGGTSVRWLAGLSYLSANTRILAEIRTVSGATQEVGALNQDNQELSAFADLSLPVSAHWRIDGGARLSRSTTDDERSDGGTATIRRSRRTSIIPSASISWSPDKDHFAWLRYASAFRPAGLNPFGPASSAAFDSDELKSIELGTRLRSADGRWSLGATGYFTNWNDVQSDYVLSNGLIATRNSGRAMIYGAEASVGWTSASWQVSGGLNVQHARLERPQPGLLLPPDNALPIVPGYKAHLSARRIVFWDQGKLTIGMRGTLVGPGRLSLDPALNRRIGARASLGVDAGYERGSWVFSLGIDNLAGSHRDTFGYGNPFLIPTTAQRTPMRPRALRVGIRKRWR